MTTFFTNLYYISTVFFIWYELMWILYPKEQSKKTKDFINLAKELKDKKWDEYPDSYKSMIRSNISKVYMLIWLFIGIFTVQWVVFASYFAFNFIIISPMSKLFLMKGRGYTTLQWVSSVIGLIFSLFVLINHYHLNIDSNQIIKHFIK